MVVDRPLSSARSNGAKLSAIGTIGGDIGRYRNDKRIPRQPGVALSVTLY